MADERPKSPERYYKREQIFFQHPAVRDMPRLSDALKDRDKQGNVPLAAHEALAREKALQEGDIEGETHYGRIRRLNNEWNADHPVYREHRAELHPWTGEDYNRRALHHVQFGIKNGGGAMTTKPEDMDHIRVNSMEFTDPDTKKKTTHVRFERVPIEQDLVEGVAKALGTHAPMPEGYPKDFPEKASMKENVKKYGWSNRHADQYNDPDPRTRQN